MVIIILNIIRDDKQFFSRKIVNICFNWFKIKAL